MGFGDAIMATARARGFHAQGKLAAFGDGRRIKWTNYCDDIFANNPNIARPGAEGKQNLVWFPHYKKHLVYCKYDGLKHRYVWNYDFSAEPGELFFNDPGNRLPLASKSYIVIEPNVAWQRTVNVNKDWGAGKYEKVAKALIERGHTIVQCIHGNSRRKIPGAYYAVTATFHEAIQIMSDASLFIGPEGGNHHAAAAIGVPAIILWGGWSPPETMGYKTQIKLTGGATEACGITYPCSHCRGAFDNISIDEVYHAAIKALQ